jgi:hypothetical protein
MLDKEAKMISKQLLTGLVISVLPIVILICISCVQFSPHTSENHTEPALTTSPSETSVPETDQAKTITILSDSFVLDRISYTGECAEIVDWAKVDYPFNKCGLYISEPFFVKDNETFELIVTADCPIGHIRGDARDGIYVDCIQSYKSTLSQTFSLDFDLNESSHLERSGTRWTRTFIIKTDNETDYKWYQIQMYNEGTTAFKCEYTMSVIN